LILFIAGLIISLTVGQGTSLGLIFGIPLLVAGLIIPLFMLRDLFVTAEVKEPCRIAAGPSARQTRRCNSDANTVRR
jgi:hypothetical protein